MAGGGLVFELAAQGSHLLVGFSLDRGSFHLDGLQGTCFLILEFVLDGFQPFLNKFLYLTQVCCTDLNASIRDHRASAAKNDGLF